MLLPTVLPVTVIFAWVASVRFTVTVPYGPVNPEMAEFPFVRVKTTWSALALMAEPRATSANIASDIATFRKPIIWGISNLLFLFSEDSILKISNLGVFGHRSILGDKLRWESGAGANCPAQTQPAKKSLNCYIKRHAFKLARARR